LKLSFSSVSGLLIRMHNSRTGVSNFETSFAKKINFSNSVNYLNACLFIHSVINSISRYILKDADFYQGIFMYFQILFQVDVPIQQTYLSYSSAVSVGLVYDFVF